MQTHETRSVAEGLIDAWNREDFRAIEGIVASDFVNHNPPPLPGIGRDRDGLLRAMRYMRSAFPDGQAHVLQMIAEGDKVLVHDCVRGTHDGDFMGIGPTGRQVSFEFMHLFRVRDGKIVERWGLVDVMTLLQQLGAAPLAQPAGAAT